MFLRARVHRLVTVAYRPVGSGARADRSTATVSVIVTAWANDRQTASEIPTGHPFRRISAAIAPEDRPSNAKRSPAGTKTSAGNRRRYQHPNSAPRPRIVCTARRSSIKRHRKRDLAAVTLAITASARVTLR